MCVLNEHMKCVRFLGKGRSFPRAVKLCQIGANLHVEDYESNEGINKYIQGPFWR